MEGDDTRSEVAIGDAGEAGPANPLAQGDLIRPLPDGVGEIAVSLRVGTGGTDDRRHEVAQVCGIPGTEDRPRWLGELADHEATAGFEHAIHLGEGQLGVFDVSQAEGDRDGVEFAVLEGKRHGIRLDESEVRMLVPADLDHPRGEVGSDHIRPAAGQGCRTGARASRDVEDAFAGLCGDGPHGRDAPDDRVAHRQHGVGAIVVLRNPIEHRGDLLGVLTQICLGHGDKSSSAVLCISGLPESAG